MMAVRRCVDVARRAFLLLCLQNLALVAVATFFSCQKSPTDSTSSLTEASLEKPKNGCVVGKAPRLTTTSLLPRKMRNSTTASFFRSSFSKRSIVESHTLPVDEEVLVHSTQQERPEHATTRDSTNGSSVTARTPAKLQGSNAVEVKLQPDFCSDRDLTHDAPIAGFFLQVSRSRSCYFSFAKLVWLDWSSVVF